MTTERAATHYYDAFNQKSDFSEVPFAETVSFRGPTGTIDGAAPLRAVLGDLSQRVQALTVRHQLSEGDQVVTVYDFDLGLPDGPIPMAERLAFVDGEITEIELLFDAGRLPG